MFHAIQQLPAQRRWCITGTPIQNRLEDLGSLVAFLRIQQMEQASTFRKYIIVPTSPERGSQFMNLQILLKTICLRRTRDILGLPEPIAHLRPLTFSPQERQQYDELYEYYRQRVQMAVSGVLKVNSTTLQSIHELRLFCNNGPRRTRGESDDEALSYLTQLEQNQCAKCSLPIYYIDQVGDKNSGVFITPCKHLVCHSCLPQTLDKKRVCMLCASRKDRPDLANHIRPVTTDSVEEGTPFQYPSKLLALVRDIQMEPRNKWYCHPQRSLTLKAHQDDSVVFSSWKKTLDLAAELLKQAGLKFDFIHGGLHLKQRLKVLTDFKSILGPNVLLMTLGTGAEGFVR
jgi:SWI/SNF-related matrix-associated actin-dependent regulator of chromatin subfamily A3